MPRQARRKADTNTYHIILRGVNKQAIFCTEGDKKRFLQELQKRKEKFSILLYAYVLMDNHVHLLIHGAFEKISKLMQGLTISYSLYFNKKYERVGHLFQNRFHSEPVETRSYLLNVQRYIHQNPEKAGISKTQEYQWSSYAEYKNKAKIVDSQLILSFFGQDKKQAVQNFIYFHQTICNNQKEEQRMEMEQATDEKVEQWIKEELKIEKIEQLQEYNKTIRDKKIAKLVKNSIFPKSQIARVLQISRKIVERAVRDNVSPNGQKCPKRNVPLGQRKEKRDGKG